MSQLTHLLALSLLWVLATAATAAAATGRSDLADPPNTPLAARSDARTLGVLNALRQQAKQTGTTRVIVGVRASFRPEGFLAGTAATRQREDISRAQETVLRRVPSLAARPDKVKRFESIPFMAFEVDATELETLVNLTDVTSIEEDRLAAPSLSASVPLAGGTGAWTGGYTGLGQVIAILDTGIDKTHEFLAGKVISEACYSSNYPPHTASSVCPGGVTQSTLAGTGVNCAGISGCDHGTHVAGIAAGKGPSFSGVAKDAAVIAVQVFSRFDSSTYCGSATPCVLSYTSDQIRGLQRIYELRDTYAIAAVNMSLGGDSYSSQSTCDSSNPSIKSAIDQLRSVNIPTVIAAGNNGYNNSMNAPGCISSAISVGASWDTAGYSNSCYGNNLGSSAKDRIACYSNFAPFLNLFAPGSLINSSVPGNAYANFQGTSMATPHVAGAWAILRQKDGNLSVTDALNALTSTGTPVSDFQSSVTRPRIQIDAALDVVGNAGTPPSAPTIGTAVAGDARITVSFTPGSLGSGTLVGHTADCGGVTADGTSSPIVVTGLPNGISYTCRARTTTTAGTSPWSSASNTVMPAAPEEGFPGGSLPANWVSAIGSSAPWEVTYDTASAGGSSLTSGAISHDQFSDISYTANFSSGTVRFARRVSSELGYDFLEFYIDGILQNRWSGEVPWSVVTFPITSGTHTLSWRYVKDYIVSSGSDRAWIDAVTLPVSGPAQLVQRAFVSANGSDSNAGLGCPATAPCRWFYTAVTVVAAGGEVIALDSGPFGSVTLTRSVSLSAAPGIYAGISVFSGSGIRIDTPGINVTLRGITINGQGGTNGILMSTGARLSLENSVISNFLAGQGIHVTTSAQVSIIDTVVRDNAYGALFTGGATASISGSKFLSNSTSGIAASGAAGSTTEVAVSDVVVTGSYTAIEAYAETAAATAAISVVRSSVTNSTYGVAARSNAGTAYVAISESLVTGNGTGLLQTGAGSTLESLGNNAVNRNTINASGTITHASSM